MSLALSAPPTPAAASSRPWVPKRVLVTPDALRWPHGQAMVQRAAALGVEVIELPANRLTGLRGADDRESYRLAKQALAVVVAPAGKLRFQPIPPSADWRIDLAEGCPAHCQYCYLAGSLTGPPITRAYANLPDILAALPAHLGRGTITSRQAARAAEGTTFEASCYTDPLAIEHITGSLAATIRHFGAWDAPVQLRWTTKFDAVAPLLALPHNGRTRIRFSVNAASVARFEGGAPPVAARLRALGEAARAGYKVGLTIAPIIPVPNWQAEYDALIDAAAAALAGAPDPDLSVELITHRFTDTSRDQLLRWYPGTRLEMDPDQRDQKRTKFGGVKHVFPRAVMRELRAHVEARLAHHLPAAKLLYWT